MFIVPKILGPVPEILQHSSKPILRLEEELLTDIFSQIRFKALGCKPPFNNQPLLAIK